MRTTPDRGRWGWWGKVGILGAALGLPGGLVVLLYLITRSRTRKDSTPRDPYIEWLLRDRNRSEWRPAASVEGATSTRERGA